jgi:Glycosyl transferase family 2
MQASRRQRRAGQPAVLRLEDPFQLLGQDAPLADLEESSGDRAHHVLKKTIPGDPEDPGVFGSFPSRVENDAVPVLDFRRRRAERRKVVGPEEACGASVHQLFVQRIAERINVSRLKRADDRRSPDVVLVGFRARRAPGMKARFDFFHRKNSDFRTQQRVDAAQNGVGIHGPDRFDIGDLAVSVDSGVGTARAGDIHFVVEQFLKRLLEFALNRTQLRLDLPPMKVGPVIGESQLEVPHSMGYSITFAGPAPHNMRKISATIITLNEREHIGEAIASLACCDEIVVVDSGSSDGTQDIARACGARVVERAWDGYSKQKNFAAGQAQNDWILSVDADERVSMELAEDIAEWRQTSGEPAAAAYSMARRVFYLGKWINHSGWYPDRKIRLYDRRRSRWAGDFVHERLVADGPVDSLNGDLLHFPYRDWKDHEDRIERYTELAARAASSDGRRGNVLKLALAPPLTFLKSFVLHAGFLDGWRGLAIAYMGARYVFKREFRILR